MLIDLSGTFGAADTATDTGAASRVARRPEKRLAVALLALVAACGSGSGSEPAGAGRAAESTGSTGTELRQRIELPSPDWLAADDEHVYVRLDGGTVRRLDPENGETLGTTDIGGDSCQGIGVGFGAVWSCRGSDVVRIDPAADEITATVAVGKAAEQGHFATGLGRVWVLTGDGTPAGGD